jgi:two-component system, OmpR family, KDP operon response regulator KdpE
MVRILLVEDEKNLRTTLRDALQLEGYSVITAASSIEALRICEQSQVTHNKNLLTLDLILLDLGLPDGDGTEILKKVRRRYETPIIIISAREGETDKIDLLDAGADDYLVKPFGIGEILARIRVAMRHRGNRLRPAKNLYQKDGLTIDLIKRRVIHNDHPVHLTPKEYALLARLVRNAGHVITHRQLLMDVWGQEYVDHSHYLRLFIGQLRAKLEVNPADPQFIITEAGVGYQILDDTI